MFYLFDNEISTETVNDLVYKLEQCDEEIELWFATNGGDAFAMNFLVNYFNTIYDRLHITITRRLYSAGTLILTDYHGKIKLDLDNLDSIIYHLADRETLNFRKDDYSTNSKILSSQDKEYNLNFAQKLKEKELLTEKQLKQFLNGKDVVVYKKQFEKYKF